MMTSIPLDTALRASADRVTAELSAQDDAWTGSGWTRRRFLAGAGMVGVAALGTQLVTSRAAYAATPSTSDNTLIVVFLRGAADGLRALVPNSSPLGIDYLQSVRPRLLPSADSLIPLPGQSGWALNAMLQPLYDCLWSTGELAFVPAVSASGISRSHFDAQHYLESGGAPTLSTGWLERLIEQMGPGTTFRAVAEGAQMPGSLSGTSTAVTVSDLDNFAFPSLGVLTDSSMTLVKNLYRGLNSTLAEDVTTTFDALGTAGQIRTVVPTSVTYPAGAFASSLKDLAMILRAEVGMQVATVDVGGWDTHTSEAGDLDASLSATASALRAFMDDLGPTRRSRVTVVVMTEFGRRVAMNGSGGTDHGHGSVMWMLGGGLAGSGVYGKWNQLTATALDHGDVPGLNNPFDVLGELAGRRLNPGSLTPVFPGHTVSPIGLTSAY